VMGWLRRQRARSDDVFSFEYAQPWLERGDAFAFDPDLALVRGPQYPAAGREIFGIFLDSSPDRWGRILMQRREALRARREGRRPRALPEWAFLLGVHDQTRLGALRFRAASGLPFLDSDPQQAAPPIASLRKLQAASLAFEEHRDDDSHPELERWLSQLFAPGTSLGGARPKASVRDETGALCMAKFPSRKDTKDIGAWELVANRLAARAGITVPEARGLRLSGSSYTTFLSKRFDRTPSHGRVAFVSAMTMTQRIDGEPGVSYLELVDLLQSHGAATAADCQQLFRRVIFSILIHNTDDHLRNHGFFLDTTGLRLSPAFDLNPSIEGRDLSLAINEVETRCDVSIALEACGDYGLPRKDATRIVDEVRKAVGLWRQEAEALGISRWKQEEMAAAFEE
ncbi:MAG: HipA domain-containing protein, partial [bacterium]|nr:HipA domain-containing protein [bacterium]